MVFPSTATTHADTRERVVSVAPPAHNSTVVNDGAVRDDRIAVPHTVGIFVDSESVAQTLVTLVAVAPIVVTKRLAHFFNVVPKSSVLSVSDTREVLIATEARLSRAVVAPEPPDEATVTVPADAVPHVVNVIPLPSMSCTLPPVAERVTV